MGRHKIYTEEQRIGKRRESSRNWARKNKKSVNENSIRWAKNNPERIKEIRIRYFNRAKDIPIYRINRLWYLMVSRCYNPMDKRYKSYGGRGIIICKEWLDDKSLFIKWSIDNGYSLGLTIDRINNDGNYEPSNCRYTDRKTQNNNRRDNIHIIHNGVDKTLAEWAKYYKIPKATLWWRYKKGHSIIKLFTQHHLQSRKLLIDENY